MPRFNVFIIRNGAKGGSGLELHLDQVPTREPGISPYEMMLSETQERMLLVVEKGTEQKF